MAKGGGQFSKHHLGRYEEGLGLPSKIGSAISWAGGTRAGLATTGVVAGAYGMGSAMYDLSRQSSAPESVGFGTYGSHSFSGMKMHSRGMENSRLSQVGLVQAMHNGR
jgi:hypothetical protein